MKKLLALALFAVAAFGADLTGTWNFSVETDAGSGSPTITLKQDGAKLTGNYSGQLGDAPLTGSVNGDKFQFSFKASPAGDEVVVKYQGAIEGNGLKGTVELGTLAKGTFTAKRQ